MSRALGCLLPSGELLVTIRYEDELPGIDRAADKNLARLLEAIKAERRS